MNYYWKDGFFDEPQTGRVEISEEYWCELLDGQSSGSSIYSDENGYPRLRPYEEHVPTEQELAEQRMTAIQQELKKSDYQVTKCSEATMMNLPLPYDIVILCTERDNLRVEYNQLETLWNQE